MHIAAPPRRRRRPRACPGAGRRAAAASFAFPSHGRGMRAASAPSGHRSRAVHGVAWDLRLTIPEFRPTTTRPKIKSLLLSEVPALASARLGPRARGPVPSVSLCSPGPEIKHQRSKRTPRHRWAVTRPSCCRPRRAVRRRAPAPRFTDAHSMTRAIWAGPSRVTRHASPVSHPRIYPLGPPRIRGDRCVWAIHCV
jgi:hypothetical protein